MKLQLCSNLVKKNKPLQTVVDFTPKVSPSEDSFQNIYKVAGSNMHFMFWFLSPQSLFSLLLTKS